MSNLLVESTCVNIIEMQRIIDTYRINVYHAGEESMGMIVSPDLLPLITEVVQPDETVFNGNITIGHGSMPVYRDVVVLSFKTGGDWFLEMPLTNAEELRHRGKKRKMVADLPAWSW